MPCAGVPLFLSLIPYFYLPFLCLDTQVLTFVLKLPTVFSRVMCCTSLHPTTNRLFHITQACNKLNYLCLCNNYMMFSQWRNCLTTYFSVRIPIVKQWMPVFHKLYSYFINMFRSYIMAHNYQQNSRNDNLKSYPLYTMLGRLPDHPARSDLLYQLR